MAVTEFSASDPQARKVWSDQTWADIIHKTEINRFMGTGEDAIIRRLTDLEKGRGDTIYYDLRLQLDDFGVVGSDRLQGNEDSLEYTQDSIVLNQRRMGVANRRLSQQRTVHDLRRHTREALTDQWADYLDNLMYAQLAGLAQDGTGLSAAYTAEGRTPVAPDANHVYDPSTSMDLAAIDYVVEMAKETTPLMRPAMIDGQPHFMLVMHPAATRGLKGFVGSNDWTTLSLGNLQTRAGARGPTNPLFTGALGMYNNVVLHESTRIPWRTTEPQAQNVFLGAGAGTVAFGNAYSELGPESPMQVDALASWFERSDDYGEEWGFAVGAIYGIKKARFTISGTARDYGVIVIQTDNARII
jgi:N4-gp56 family major capsid protein